MKLYIETTVPHFLFADDSPEKKAITKQFFAWANVSSDEFYISELVLAELSRAYSGRGCRVMKKAVLKEPRILLEVRRIKEEIAQEAEKDPEFYQRLNGLGNQLLKPYRKN